MNYVNQKHFEILAVFITAALKFILMDWLNWRAFYLTGICLFWLGYIFFQVKTDRESVKFWGFKKEHFRQTMLCLAPLIFIVIIVSPLFSSFNKSLFFSWQFILVLFLYSLWGIIQQFIMLGIISNSMVSIAEVKINKYLLIVLISILFSLIHYPDFFLMIFTFSLELIFITVYLKWRNLWAIGIAHGWIASFILYFVLGRDLWAELLSSF